MNINRTRKERIVRFGAMLVLFGALAPNILYVGHWPVGHGEDAHTIASLAGQPQQQDNDDHALHCHTGPSKCAGGESMVGTYWAGENTELLSFDVPRLKFEIAETIPAVEGPSARILQPPRSSV